MQVKPIKPTMKVPGIKLLKLKHDKPLSNFVFNFNLHRYMEVIANIIGQRGGGGGALTLDKIAATGVFIRWVGTGAVACVEDGGHQRPNRAALVARDIFVNMETVAGELYKVRPPDKS